MSVGSWLRERRLMRSAVRIKPPRASLGALNRKAARLVSLVSLAAAVLGSVLLLFVLAGAGESESRGSALGAAGRGGALVLAMLAGADWSVSIDVAAADLERLGSSGSSGNSSASPWVSVWPPGPAGGTEGGGGANGTEAGAAAGDALLVVTDNGSGRCRWRLVPAVGSEPSLSSPQPGSSPVSPSFSSSSSSEPPAGDPDLAFSPKTIPAGLRNATRLELWIDAPRGGTVTARGFEFPCELRIVLPQAHPGFGRLAIVGDQERRVVVERVSPTLNSVAGKSGSGNGGVDAARGLVPIEDIYVRGLSTSIRLERVALGAADVDIVHGRVEFVNATVARGSRLRSEQGSVLLHTLAPFVAKFEQPKEHLCIAAQGETGAEIAARATCAGALFDSCAEMRAGATANGTSGSDGASSASSSPGASGALIDETQCYKGCARGSVAVGPVGPSSPVVEMSSLEAPVHARYLASVSESPDAAAGESLGGVWQGFGGAKPVNFTKASLAALAAIDVAGSGAWDMVSLSVRGPGAPEGLYLWAKREIYLAVHPPVLDLVSAGLLVPRTHKGVVNLAPAFCPDLLWDPATGGNAADATATATATATRTRKSMRNGRLQRRRLLGATDAEDVHSEDLFRRKVELAGLIERSLGAPTRSMVAIREGCIGNFIFKTDEESGLVEKRSVNWNSNLAILVLGGITLLIGLAVMVVTGVGILLGYRRYMKKMRADLVSRLRNLRASGYYALPRNSYLYYVSDDPARWKTGFYISDPFGRISALRSMRESTPTLSDLFKALMGQRGYQTVGIHMEDGLSVVKARGMRVRDEMKRISEQLARSEQGNESNGTNANANGIDGHMHSGADGFDDDGDGTATAGAGGSTNNNGNSNSATRGKKSGSKTGRIGSKIQAAAEQRAREEEESLVKSYLGPFVILDLFVEALWAVLVPGAEEQRQFDADAVEIVKRLVEDPTETTAVAAVVKAIRISDTSLKVRTMDHIKQRCKSFIDAINPLISRWEQRRKGALGALGLDKLTASGGEGLAQVGRVLAHIAILSIPGAIVLGFAYGFDAAWSREPEFRECITTATSIFPAVVFALGYYFVTYLKLMFFYLEWERMQRPLRPIFMGIVNVIAALTSLMVAILVCWIVLGLLVNPERAAAPATSVGTLVLFIVTQRARLVALRKELTDSIKREISHQQAEVNRYLDRAYGKNGAIYRQVLGNRLREEGDGAGLIKPILETLGFSSRRIGVILLVGTVTLAAIFAFIFLGIAVFDDGTEGGAMALIQSALTLVAGAGFTFSRGSSASGILAAVTAKLPGIVRAALVSIALSGNENLASVSNLADSKKNKSKHNGDGDGDNDDDDDDAQGNLVMSLYGARKKVVEATRAGAMEANITPPVPGSSWGPYMV